MSYTCSQSNFDGSVVKQVFINVSCPILVASLTNSDGSVVKQFFINVSCHILVASLTLMAL